ncbi:GTPase activating protein Rap1-GAP [Thecamonas trahens ATCC 50062]|uniref:GTPase activating protein Rap1-GAP n=1 Tax=Thecamonas trahens ATCC 50062 TaxID=461836 RepID=A0A0L0DV53_THETB|nr:GTPase activating protein Rap1-GAP [Thecamonas trahens ATCC 50062]KNC55418.1 GTPase activating protein Rap1-GAP [Thecamonas trahens ATCC 50062]|eukprot:XP_013752957.1 GTPase activating protein Rap1-GAP [Thecamonas trahens ATCC 50062]
MASGRLLAAVSSGDVSVINDLLSTKPRLAKKAYSGKYLAHLAVESGHDDVLEAVLEGGAAADATNTAGATPLHVAAGLPSVDFVVLLLAAAPDTVHAVDDNGWSPLFMAAAAGDVAVADALLAAGAKVNSADELGWSPLIKAAASGQAGMVRRLIEAGARVNAVTQFGESALHRAAAKGFVDVVVALIGSAADLNLRTVSERKSPAFLALEAGHVDALRVLRDAGADLQLCNVEGTSPLDRATELRDAGDTNMDAAIEILVSASGDVDNRSASEISLVEQTRMLAGGNRIPSSRPPPPAAAPPAAKSSPAGVAASPAVAAPAPVAEAPAEPDKPISLSVMTDFTAKHDALLAALAAPAGERAQTVRESLVALGSVTKKEVMPLLEELKDVSKAVQKSLGALLRLGRSFLNDVESDEAAHAVRSQLAELADAVRPHGPPARPPPPATAPPPPATAPPPPSTAPPPAAPDAASPADDAAAQKAARKAARAAAREKALADAQAIADKAVAEKDAAPAGAPEPAAAPAPASSASAVDDLVAELTRVPNPEPAPKTKTDSASRKDSSVHDEWGDLLTSMEASKPAPAKPAPKKSSAFDIDVETLLVEVSGQPSASHNIDALLASTESDSDDASAPHPVKPKSAVPPRVVPPMERKSSSVSIPDFANSSSDSGSGSGSDSGSGSGSDSGSGSNSSSDSGSVRDPVPAPVAASTPDSDSDSGADPASLSASQTSNATSTTAATAATATATAAAAAAAVAVASAANSDSGDSVDQADQGDSASASAAALSHTPRTAQTHPEPEYAPGSPTPAATRAIYISLSGYFKKYNNRWLRLAHSTLTYRKASDTAEAEESIKVASIEKIESLDGVPDKKAKKKWADKMWEVATSSVHLRFVADSTESRDRWVALLREALEHALGREVLRVPVGPRLGHDHITGSAPDQLIAPARGWTVEEPESSVAVDFDVPPTLQNPKLVEQWYRTYFVGLEHANFIGQSDDAELGTVVISLVQESYRRSLPLLRAIVWTRTGIQRMVVPLRKKLKNLKRGLTRLIEARAPELTKLRKRMFLSSNPQLQTELLKIEETEVEREYKIGLLYVKHGQTSELDMFANDASPETDAPFLHFLSLLGTNVRLQGWNGFRGGLDAQADGTGKYSVFADIHGCDIMFHVSTLLPHGATEQEVQRKRQIGNDIVCLVFVDGNTPFNPNCIESQFLHVFIVVQPAQTRGVYRVSVVHQSCMSSFGPPLPSSVWYADAHFINVLLTKALNAQRSAIASSPTFVHKSKRTLGGLLDSIFSVVVDTKKEFASLTQPRTDDDIATTILSFGGSMSGVRKGLAPPASKTAPAKADASESNGDGASESGKGKGKGKGKDKGKGKGKDKDKGSATLTLRRKHGKRKASAAENFSGPRAMVPSRLSKVKAYDVKKLVSNFKHLALAWVTTGLQHFFSTEKGLYVLSPTKEVKDAVVLLSKRAFCRLSFLAEERILLGQSASNGTMYMLFLDSVGTPEMVKIRGTKGTQVYATAEKPATEATYLVTAAGKSVVLYTFDTSVFVKTTKFSAPKSVKALHLSRDALLMVAGAKALRYPTARLVSGAAEPSVWFESSSKKIKLEAAAVAPLSQRDALITADHTGYVYDYDGTVSRKFTLSWNVIPGAVFYAPPYILGFGYSTVEVRSAENGALFQMLSLPPPIRVLSWDVPLVSSDRGTVINLLLPSTLDTLVPDVLARTALLQCVGAVIVPDDDDDDEAGASTANGDSGLARQGSSMVVTERSNVVAKAYRDALNKAVEYLTGDGEGVAAKVMGVEVVSAGKNGYCVVCGKGADFKSKDTKLAICGIPCRDALMEKVTSLGGSVRKARKHFEQATGAAASSNAVVVAFNHARAEVVRRLQALTETKDNNFLKINVTAASVAPAVIACMRALVAVGDAKAGRAGPGSGSDGDDDDDDDVFDVADELLAQSLKTSLQRCVKYIDLVSAEAAAAAADESDSDDGSEIDEAEGGVPEHAAAALQHAQEVIDAAFSFADSPTCPPSRNAELVQLARLAEEACDAEPRNWREVRRAVCEVYVVAIREAARSDVESLLESALFSDRDVVAARLNKHKACMAFTTKMEDVTKVVLEIVTYH